MQFPAYGFSPARSVPENKQAATPPSPAEEFTELQQLLHQAKKENKVLEQTVELEKMRQELQALRLRNTELEGKRATPLNDGGEPKQQSTTTLRDLRSKKSLTSQVDAFLAHLAESSSDESDGDDINPSRASKGRRHGLKSGKASKLTSRVVHPQLWPHSHLSLAYIFKDKKYDDLTLAEFTAGYAAIRARIDHLASLMYLATQFTWSSVRELHAALLFEIECGRANWGDSFSHLESRILQATPRQSRTGAPRAESSSPAVFFCRDFQHGTCKVTKDHYGTIRGERTWLQHICARCWVDSRTVSRHTEFSKDCPLAAKTISTTNPPETPTP